MVYGTKKAPKKDPAAVAAAAAEELAARVAAEAVQAEAKVGQWHRHPQIYVFCFICLRLCSIRVLCCVP